MLRENSEDAVATLGGRNRLAKALTIEWLGQTAASMCWICSMLIYGISSAGDWLQVFAASAWFVANVATLAASNASSATKMSRSCRRRISGKREPISRSSNPLRCPPPVNINSSIAGVLGR